MNRTIESDVNKNFHFVIPWLSTVPTGAKYTQECQKHYVADPSCLMRNKKYAWRDLNLFSIRIGGLYQM